MGIFQQILFWGGVFYYSLVGLNAGYYQPDTNRYALAYLYNLENGADKSIIVDGNYSFTIKLEPGKPPNDSAQHADLSLSKLLPIPKKEKKHDLLVVRLHPIVVAHGREAEFMESLKGPLMLAGYKRVVFLGAASSGVHYLADIQSAD